MGREAGSGGIDEIDTLFMLCRRAKRGFSIRIWGLEGVLAGG